MSCRTPFGDDRNYRRVYFSYTYGVRAGDVLRICIDPVPGERRTANNCCTYEIDSGSYCVDSNRLGFSAGSERAGDASEGAGSE